MVDIMRMRVEWTGFPGAPGVSTLYGTSFTSLKASIAAFFLALNGILPADVTITVPNSGDTLDPITGLITGTWSVGTPDYIYGLYTGSYAGPCGASVRWDTGTVLHGHRLRGRTYIVPLADSCYQNDGSLATAQLSTLNVAAAGLVTAAAGALVVWNRPKPGVAGGFSAVNGSSVADRVAVLRSRRG